MYIANIKSGVWVENLPELMYEVQKVQKCIMCECKYTSLVSTTQLPFSLKSIIQSQVG